MSGSADFDLNDLLAWLDDKVSSEFKVNPEVVEVDDVDVASLPIDARRWHRLDDAVAVVADLKGSTALGYSQKSASTAAIMEATVGGFTEILRRFEVNYVQAQGDGGFGLFWGERRFERAMCAAVTLQTFSEKSLIPGVGSKWPAVEATGLKVGVASGPVLVKRVGTPRQQHLQDAVWVGKPVNYAAKCAQQTRPGRLVVTRSIWRYVEGNDFLVASCGCGGGPSTTIWSDIEIEHLRPDDAESHGKVLTSSWCDKGHGQEFCAAILAGCKRRSDMSDIRAALDRQLMERSFGVVQEQRQTDLRNHRRGLT